MAASEADLLLQEKMATPPASFTSAIDTAKGSRPQAIAHRGYKAAHPENTMGAFIGAVKVGAHAIETDVHLSRDGIVVLSHDATLKRCFGLDEKIMDCDWSYLETLRTLKEPSEHMPRLKDLLEYLAKKEAEDIWVLLDIKLDDDPDELIGAIASTIDDAKSGRPWNQRILLGCWNEKYLPICKHHLPDFPIVHIGWNIGYARKFLQVPGVSFNMFQKMVIGPIGAKFRRDVRKAGRSLFLWTVNDERSMKWCISKNVDGVITDDPKKYLELCDSYNGEQIDFPILTWGALIFMNLLSPFFKIFLKLKFRRQKHSRRITAGRGITKGITA